MRYLKNSSGCTHIFEVAYLNGMCANVPRCTIPIYIQDFSEKSKMEPLEFLGNWLRYLRNSSGSTQVFRDA